MPEEGPEAILAALERLFPYGTVTVIRREGRIVRYEVSGEVLVDRPQDSLDAAAVAELSRLLTNEAK